MSRVPSSVTIVTARGDDEMRGVTIGSFTSLSLTPPLISFNLGRQSRMHALLDTGTRFAVHVLTANQSNLPLRFSRPGCTGAEQFEDVSYVLNEDGTPILDEAALVLYCELEQLVEVGQKSIVIGRVLHATSDEKTGPVLLYHQHTFYGMSEHAELVLEA